MNDIDKLIAEIGEENAKQESERLQIAFDACTDIDPDADSIDSQVATWVMGWQYIDRKKAGWGDGPKVWLTQSAYSPTHQDFRPSTNDLDALLVLYKLREKHTAKIWMGKNNWRVSLAHGVCASAWEATIPLAICKAALAGIAAAGGEGK